MKKIKLNILIPISAGAIITIGGIITSVVYYANHQSNAVKEWSFKRMPGPYAYGDYPPFGKWPYAYVNRLKIYPKVLDNAIRDLNKRVIARFGEKYGFNKKIWVKHKRHMKRFGRIFLWAPAPEEYYKYGRECFIPKSKTPVVEIGRYGFWENYWDQKFGFMRNKAIYICEKKIKHMMDIAIPDKGVRYFQDHIRAYGIMLHEAGHGLIGENHPKYGTLMLPGIAGHSITNETWRIIEKALKKQVNNSR